MMNVPLEVPASGTVPLAERESEVSGIGAAVAAAKRERQIATVSLTMVTEQE